MNASEINAIRYKLMGMQQIHGVGWFTKFARKAGYSVGTLRCFRNGNYKGDNERIAETLKAIFAGETGNLDSRLHGNDEVTT